MFLVGQGVFRRSRLFWEFVIWFLACFDLNLAGYLVG